MGPSVSGGRSQIDYPVANGCREVGLVAGCGDAGLVAGRGVAGLVAGCGDEGLEACSQMTLTASIILNIQQFTLS